MGKLHPLHKVKILIHGIRADHDATPLHPREKTCILYNLFSLQIFFMMYLWNFVYWTLWPNSVLFLEEMANLRWKMRFPAFVGVILIGNDIIHIANPVVPENINSWLD